MVSGLKDLGDFVGFGDNTAPRVDGGTDNPRIATSMVAVGTHLPLLPAAVTRSLRGLIQALPTLPAITLDVTSTNGLDGPQNFAPQFRVAPSPGNVYSTVANAFDSAGRNVSFGQKSLPLAFVGGVVGFGDPGHYTVRFNRFGVTGAGLQILQQEFPVTIHAAPPPPPPPPPPTPSPVITVNSVGDGSFKISGSGFQPKAVVTFTIVSKRDPFDRAAALQDSADATGAIKDFPTGKICLVPGLPLVFSAQDGRIDPSTHQAVVSNFVTVSCPL